MAKILVVDDDPDFVRVTAKVLQKMGHDVTSAANGTKALQSMRQDRPDLVLLDIMMSYILDGLDVSREMSQDPTLKDVPVLIVTSLTAARGSGLLPADGYVPADEWLAKPVDPGTLQSRISAVLAAQPVA